MPITSAKNGCCGPPVARAAPSFVTCNHTAPSAGSGFPNTIHAAVMPPARRRPQTTGATIRRVTAPAFHFTAPAPVVVVVVVGDRPAPSRVTIMLYDVIRHPPKPSGCTHEVGQPDDVERVVLDRGLCLHVEGHGRADQRELTVPGRRGRARATGEATTSRSPVTLGRPSSNTTLRSVVVAGASVAGSKTVAKSAVAGVPDRSGCTVASFT